MKHLPACTLLFAVIFTPTAHADATPPFVHLQTDRPSYRLGETIWFRGHAPEEHPITVTLLDAHNVKVAGTTFSPNTDKLQAGRFLIPLDATGGTYHLIAKTAGHTSHVLPLEVYDLSVPQLDVDLKVLGELFYPGDKVTAVFKACDLKGKPVEGAKVEYLATFGSRKLRAAAGRTGQDGRAIVRFTLPQDAGRPSRLAVGIAHRGKRAALSRRIPLSTAVAQLDAFPEGGTLLAGHSQKLALYLRGPEGFPTGAMGRIVDAQDRTVTSFSADSHGLATAFIQCKAGEQYRAVIDRPAGCTRKFPLPAPSGHPYGLLVDCVDKGFRVMVYGDKETENKPVWVMLKKGSLVLNHYRLHLTQKGSNPLPTARAIFSAAGMNGIGYFVLGKDKQVFIKRPVFMGSPSPIKVTVTPAIKGPLHAGKDIELVVKARWGGKPISADLALSLYQGNSGAQPGLALRSIFGASCADALLPPAMPRADDEEGHARLDTFLLVHHAYQFPAKGVPLPDSGLLAWDTGKVSVPLLKNAGAPHSRAKSDGKTEHKGRTIVRDDRLERLLKSAHYTRRIRDKSDTHAFNLRVPPKLYLKTPGLGHESQKPPQQVMLPPGQLDTRKTMFWGSRIKTDHKGTARIRLRLNHMIDDLCWKAEGYGKAHPISARGFLKPDPGYTTRFKAPSHLHVGDILEFMLSPEISDQSKEPVHLHVQAPACLKPLLRTSETYRPAKDKKLHKFKFQAIAPADDVKLSVYATRGLYREIHENTFSVVSKEIEKIHGKSGRGKGKQEFTFTLPESAVDDSVILEGCMMPGSIAELLESLGRLFRVPSGCFEQWTSINLTNLLILDAILENGEDPLALARAFTLARNGFTRLMSHYDKKTGGFAQFPGKPADGYATTVALRHLLLYVRLFKNLGKPQLETAMTWLEKNGVPQKQALYLTLSLHEAGRMWKRSASLIHYSPRSLYEAILLAGCLARWPDERIGDQVTRENNLNQLLDMLENHFSGEHTKLTAGTGLMGSVGYQLQIESLALALIVLDLGGRHETAGRLLNVLIERFKKTTGTQATALAAKAIAQLSELPLKTPISVAFACKPGSSRVRKTVSPGRARPVRFKRTVSMKPQETATLSLTLPKDAKRGYHLNCTYRIKDPVSAEDAPFLIRTKMPAIADMDVNTTMNVTIIPRGKTPSSQVVARVAIPGGCEVTGVSSQEPLAFWEVSQGYLNLYWTDAFKSTKNIKVALCPRAAGLFYTRPSMVYPYYESGKDSYADPLKLTVINHFGNPVTQEGFLRRAGRLR